MVLTLLEAGGGFDPLNLHSSLTSFLWTAVIFVLSIGPIWKIVMGPITRALTERDEMAAKAIHSAEAASEAAEKARAEVEVKLGEARAEAARVMDEARNRAEVREREIVESAKREATTLVEQARSQIRAEKDKAMMAIRNEVVELSLQAAGQVLSRKVDSEDDRRLASELVAAAGAGGKKA